MRHRLEALLSIGALLTGCSSATPASKAGATKPVPLAEAPPEDWSMFRDDVERSGFAEGSTVGNQVEVIWRIPVFNRTDYGAAKGSPSVVGDVVYCGTDTGKFVAARVADGHVLWQAQFENTSHGVHGSPAIVGEFVYVGAYDGAVYAFDRRSGALRWRYELGYQVGSSPAVVPAWGLLFSSHERSAQGGGFVVALDARTGAEVWRRETEAHPHGKTDVKTTPTVIPNRSLVVDS
jgi:glucose dehydrogenase